MSTSLVHVLTIIGKGAEEVEAACEGLLVRRKQRDPNGYGSHDWSERDHKDIERFCATLINAARNLPVLYYAQYLDPWTVGDSRFHLLNWQDGRKRQVCGSYFGFVFYPSSFSQDVLAQIEKRRTEELYRTQAEDRWYLDHMKEAIEAALWLKETFLVVSICEALGPSRHDEAIKAALDISIGLGKPAM